MLLPLILSLFSTVQSFSCSVGTGDVQTLDPGSYTCSTIQIEGTLNIQSNTNINADRIQVEVGGKLVIGTSESPAEDVTIYLNHALGTEVPAGQLMSYGETYIYGKPKTSWTLLNGDCDSCSTLKVDECMNWSVGDRIVVATTGNDQKEFSSNEDNWHSEQRQIASISSSDCTITLDSALAYHHSGTWLDGIVPMRAEVMNMDRSILITGPTHSYSSDPQDGFQGIVTRQAGANGVMQVENTRIEKCGRVELGEYCLHFHYAGMCPECIFRGNAIAESNNKAITVHSTHRSLVHNNVVYDHRGAFLYIEDGNEYENVISSNVLVCPGLKKGGGDQNYCDLNGVKHQEDSDRGEQTGLYVNGPTNHIIGNHVVGMENALFINSNHPWGNGDSDAAVNHVCKLAYPLGVTKGNVFHNNWGFGWYATAIYSTNVLTDEDGFVNDWRSCGLWNMDTKEDRTHTTVVEDHVEYQNGWGFGVYDMGDITFRNLIAAMNRDGFYWKTYRRGLVSDVFCDNCTFYNNGAQMLIPGGSAMVEFKDTKVWKSGTNNIVINHHCGLKRAYGTTGGLCASHYWLQGVDDGGNEISFRSETYDSCGTNCVTSLQQTDATIFYKDLTYFDTYQSHPTFSTSSCLTEEKTSYPQFYWTKCPQSMGIRAIRIYSPNRGDLTVTTSSGSYTVPFRDLQRWMEFNWYTTFPCSYGPKDGNSGCSHRVWPGGYTFLVKDGESVTLHVPSYSGVMYDTFTMEYSEPQMPATSITMTVTGDSKLSGGPCEISSDHSRFGISAYGPLVPQTGAWWDCKGSWPTTSGIEEYINGIVPLRWAVSSNGEISVKGKGNIPGGSTTTTSTTAKPDTTSTTSSSSTTPTCGYVPTDCVSQIAWAVNSGTKDHPEWYPNFFEVTGVQLSAASSKDMALFWMCTSIPTDLRTKCNGLQLPCNRICSTSVVTDSPTPSPSPLPTPSPTDSCGHVPSTCDSQISWAITTGKNLHPEWYPSFLQVTGVELASATAPDMALYWMCHGIPTDLRTKCDGLEMPCNRACKSTSAADAPALMMDTGMTTGCGNIPDSCNNEIQWTLNEGRYSHPEWYADFEAITKVALNAATTNDIALFWLCTTIPNTQCGELEMPCGRECGSPCGNVPLTCTSELDWAINNGRYSNPEWYPNFASVTGKALDVATTDDMALYWTCTTIPNKEKCGGLEAPCGRSCGAITPSPTTPCGDVPATCTSELDWAISTGIHTNPEWYHDFAAVTGKALEAATTEDMALYWTCTTIPNKEKCTGLEPPCGRSCGSTSTTPSPTGSGGSDDVSRYIGFDLSIGLQSNPLSVSRVAAITAALKGVKNYKFYGYPVDVEIAKAIIAASSFPNELRFYIEISPHKVNNLQTSDIAALLDIWSDIKQYVYWIALGNEPTHATQSYMVFDVLPAKLQMCFDYLATQSGWEHTKISIPFSAGIMEYSDVPKDAYFFSKYSNSLTQIIKILQANNAPFSINWYPFFTCMYNAQLLQFCLGNEGDWSGQYESMLIAQYDSTYHAMNRLVPNNGVEIVLTEVGWATKGGNYGSVGYASTWYQNTFASMSNPASKLYGVTVFFFELFDEDLKHDGEWERNFGVYDLKGNMKLTGMDVLMGGSAKVVIPPSGDTSTQIWNELNKDVESKGNWDVTLLIASLIVIVICLLAAIHNLGCMEQRGHIAKVTYGAQLDQTTHPASVGLKHGNDFLN